MLSPFFWQKNSFGIVFLREKGASLFIEGGSKMSVKRTNIGGQPPIQKKCK